MARRGCLRQDSCKRGGWGERERCVCVCSEVSMWVITCVGKTEGAFEITKRSFCEISSLLATSSRLHFPLLWIRSSLYEWFSLQKFPRIATVKLCKQFFIVLISFAHFFLICLFHSFISLSSKAINNAILCAQITHIHTRATHTCTPTCVCGCVCLCKNN